MRALLLKSVAVTALVLTPVLASAEGPGGGAPAAGAHSPGAGGADRAAPNVGGAEGHGGEMKGDAQPGGMQREKADGNKAQAEERSPKSDRANPGDKMQKDRMQGENGRDHAGDNAKTEKSDRASGERGNARSAKITTEQRTKITTTLRSGPAKRIDNVKFSIRVGTAVPRSYHYYPLPTEIIDVVPEYRGYDYIVVGDQILIIDPESGEIVYIL